MPKSTRNASKLKDGPILGAHESIAGGYYRAVETARTCGCDCVQLFTRNNNQWRAKPITPAEAQRFRQVLAESGLSHPLAHGSYLINLASPDDTLWRKSIAAFVLELRRAETLGIPYVVTHPGSYTSGSEALGLRRIVAALDEIHAQTRGIQARCLLETTAGQGTCLGCRFEHLAAIIEGVTEPERLGVCFDTCHVFAAGYPLDTSRHYRATMRAFDRTVGLKRIRAFHLNDSRRELGSRIDRHEHIGRGQIGLGAFRNLLGEHRFRGVPMYLETPKGQDGGVDWDTINLRTLRELALE
jgi:deoxyribonuclease-4